MERTRGISELFRSSFFLLLPHIFIFFPSPLISLVLTLSFSENRKTSRKKEFGGRKLKKKKKKKKKIPHQTYLKKKAVGTRRRRKKEWREKEIKKEDGKGKKKRKRGSSSARAFPMMFLDVSHDSHARQESHYIIYIIFF
jgi:hypothetical protein